ncbi:MAG: PSD1 domain-containing protein [Planctomycetes bacterium]|nr:PSD1 domain-containing protein [Planctomycetota bacterium]
MRKFWLLGMVWIASGFAEATAQESARDFFEKRIRPVLVERCYSCHSRQANKQRGGLYVDTRAGLRQGGDHGPAIVPGKPAQSLLLKAIRHLDPKLKMPRDGKLTPAVIADFERWIALGAPDPRDEKVVASIGSKTAREHWAYQPIKKPALPKVKHQAWLQTPIDRFVLAKLEAKGLSPSPIAEPRTLIRRLYIDLIGIPPTFEEVEGFVKACEADPKGAVGSPLGLLVEKLLASPHYGERWGRHWLDVARYADTKDGVLMYGDDRVRPYAYTYRDYVIRAFNDDTPFNRFIIEQLAADRLALTPNPTAKGQGEAGIEPWRMAAMGFLTLGRQYDNNIPDVIDDRIDTVTRGFLGLTVSCARCHDHKYDAIPTADYYSLYGVFANSEAPLEPPLADRPKNLTTLAAYEKQAGPHREKMRKMLDSQYALLRETAKLRVGDYLMRVATTEPDNAETAIYFLSLAPTDLRPPMVNQWRKYLDHADRARDPVFGPWPALMNLPDALFAAQANSVLGQWKGKSNPLIETALKAANLKSKADVARAYGNVLIDVYKNNKNKPATEPVRQLLLVLESQQSPCYFPRSQTWHNMSRGEKDAYGGMKTQFDKIALRMKDAPPRAMVLFDVPEPTEPRIFKRGNPASPGAMVPRQFLRILVGDNRLPFGPGSGRLDLARAIASKDNPLTARVIVNRVLMHHFGEPLVSSPSDFGVRSTPPSHPELLDWLAWTFMEDGWSLKKLHRRIVLSSVYLQASLDRPAARKIDPENRLYWRANRRRLDLEAMRDSYLLIAGRLDRAMYGRPVDIVQDAKNPRRTVYGLVDRQSLPGFFRAFDFAVPDQSVERRPMTTVPQQALFALNSAFMAEQAKALAARTAKLEGEARVRALYRLALVRNANAGEVKIGLRFVETPAGNAPSQLTAWQQYAQVLLMTNELMFVD